MVRGELEKICRGIPYDALPEFCGRDENVIHAPFKQHGLNSAEKKKAVNNALRYFPFNTHDILRPEFEGELELYGHIYMYRFMPEVDIRAYPIDEYPGNLLDAKAIMLMIMNNLDPDVAQYPQELVTYGSNGQVFSNWAQFLLTMKYLSELKEGQTLALCSGHPLGLFPTNPSIYGSLGDLSIKDLGMPSGEKRATRLIITNGMMVPEYSTQPNYDRLFALGVTMYGQMTAGSFCYIGPQGIIHGTVITLLNVARKYLGSTDMSGKVFLSSGLGGMSGAQAKASCIVGCVGVIAEVCGKAIQKRYQQGWVKEICGNAVDCVKRVKEAKFNKESTSIAFHGNIVNLWQAFVDDYQHTGRKVVDFGSDQTSLHNPYNGGYYPQGLTLDQANALMKERPEKFKAAVQQSLCRQVTLINDLANKTGLIFWDYGNAFLLEASRAKADITERDSITNGHPCQGIASFRYPSYVQDIMGQIFALGFGPFRWICTSGSGEDLRFTENLALDVLRKRLETLRQKSKCSPSNEKVHDRIIQLYEDNITWMQHITSSPDESYLTVGSKARILYSDTMGRLHLALALNKAIGVGLKAPIILSRDHHDVSGADSPFRETSDIEDGSNLCADMSVQNILGNVARGATWVAIHNGGGVGWGQVVNNGLGLVLDGTDEALERALSVLAWDVQNGLTRRCWSSTREEDNDGDNYSTYVLKSLMEYNSFLKVTIPYEKN